jgi:pimeloyl-ACP methyl ester carboxylesterase
MATVTSHGTSIYYETYGEGSPAIVFAHGMGGNAAIWYHQVAEFSQRHKVITFDHRYFARSSCPADAFDPAKFPDDVTAIMDAENVDRAVFVCQSMGGWTGSQMAIAQPHRVLGLLMSHTPGVFEHASAVRDLRQVSEQINKPFTEIGSPALAADFPLKDRAGALLYAQISSFNGIDPSVITGAIGRANLQVNTATLSDYKVPTLFVSADHDILFPPDYIEALAATLPAAEYVNLGDAGHSSYFELPAAFNRALQNFIEQLPD